MQHDSLPKTLEEILARDENDVPIMLSPLDKLIGINYTKVQKNEVVATLKITKDLTQPMGVLHGGINVVLAESVASIGGWINTDPRINTILGQEINANHVRSGIVGDTLVAVGKPIHLGRRSQLWEIIISSQSTGKTICVSRCTITVVPLHEVQAKTGIKNVKPTVAAEPQEKLHSKL